MSLTLYELAPSRSARVRWTLLELDRPFESRTGIELFQGEELRNIHPLNKFPAFVDLTLCLCFGFDAANQEFH